MDQVYSRLTSEFGDYAHENKSDPLEELAYIICSIRTDGDSLRQSFRALKRSFPDLRDLADAKIDDIARPLREAGFATVKAKTLRSAFAAIRERYDEMTLEPLRELTDRECEEILTSLPGVGKKVARCVLLYAFNRDVFPVDSNCWRVARRLGWLGNDGSREVPTQRDMDRLQTLIPANLRFSLHVNMYSLGKSVCSKQSPVCSDCPIHDLCPRIGLDETSLPLP